jgi:hypothetical protein
VVEASTRLPADASPTLPMSSDGQHLIHTVGACLGLLAAIVMLFPMLLLRQIVERAHAAGIVALRPFGTLTVAMWSPPALDPPTSSPVVRT